MNSEVQFLPEVYSRENQVVDSGERIRPFGGFGRPFGFGGFGYPYGFGYRYGYYPYYY